MYLFLLFLILGFFFNLASAFTAAFSRRFGDRCGSLLTVLLRNVLGIPVWTIGFILAARMHARIRKRLYLSKAGMVYLAEGFRLQAGISIALPAGKDGRLFGMFAARRRDASNSMQCNNLRV